MEQVSITAKNRPALWLVFSLTFAYFLVEVIGGLITNSLALLADAAHMLTDVGGLALALFAAWMSEKPATPGKTYGYYRVEILAAATNAAVLFFISFWILFEAYRRFQQPPEVASLPMLAVAAVGLLVNLVGIFMLRTGAQESLNLQGAFLEVVSDLLGSIGVIVAGLIMWLTGWWYADPIFSVVIGLFVLPRTWKLMSQAVNVLMEGTPTQINLTELKDSMIGVDGVASVHDLHVWTLTSGFDALSAHVVIETEMDTLAADALLKKLAVVLKERFGISHSTIQIEVRDRTASELKF